MNTLKEKLTRETPYGISNALAILWGVSAWYSYCYGSLHFEGTCALASAWSTGYLKLFLPALLGFTVGTFEVAITFFRMWTYKEEVKQRPAYFLAR